MPDPDFTCPYTPEVANSPSNTALGPIGVAVSGIVFFGQYAGVNRTTGEFLPLENEIASFDSKNGHPQNTGQYHYHFEPLYLTVADNATFLVDREGHIRGVYNATSPADVMRLTEDLQLLSLKPIVSLLFVMLSLCQQGEGTAYWM